MVEEYRIIIKSRFQSKFSSARSFFIEDEILRVTRWIKLIKKNIKILYIAFTPTKKKKRDQFDFLRRRT